MNYLIYAAIFVAGVVVDHFFGASLFTKIENVILDVETRLTASFKAELAKLAK